MKRFIAETKTKSITFSAENMKEASRMVKEDFKDDFVINLKEKKDYKGEEGKIKVWWIFEVIIRFIIIGVVMETIYKAGIRGFFISVLGVIFFIWGIRPAYLNVKGY